MASVVETVTATAQHYSSNNAVRTNILSGVAPTNPALRIVHISAPTLEALQGWFAGETVDRETALTNQLTAAATQTQLETWNTNARAFGTASERYRLTLQHVGNALYPFTPLIDEMARLGNPAPFNTYVNDVKARIEAAAVNIVENFPHDEAIKRLGELATLSTRFTQGTSRRLQAGGTMTPAEIATACGVVDARVAELRNPRDVF